MNVSEMLVAISKLPPDLRDSGPVRSYVLSLPKRQDTDLTARQIEAGRQVIRTMRSVQAWRERAET